MCNIEKGESLLSSRYFEDEVSNESIPQKSKKLLKELHNKCNNEFNKKPHKACPLCSASEAYLISKKDRIGINVNILLCKECGFVFNENLFDEKDLEIIYKDYFSKIWWSSKDLNKLFEDKTNKQSYAFSRFNFIAKHTNHVKFKTIVEIGCGMGTNLYPFNSKETNLIGFDFDSEYMKIGEQHNIRMITGGDKAFFASDINPDLIILSHIVEHINDLDNFFSELNKKINNDAYIYIEVPGIVNWIKASSEKVSIDGYKSSNDFLYFLQFVHNYHFTAWHLIQFCERNGFEVVFYDEIVRMVIKKGTKKTNKKFDINLLEYLNTVEKDYLSIKNVIVRYGKIIKRYLGK